MAKSKPAEKPKAKAAISVAKPKPAPMPAKKMVARPMPIEPKPIVVSFVNLKGGVGKTSLAVNFAEYCGRRGMPTLLIDLDPQTNATLWCMQAQDWTSHAERFGTVANLLGCRNHTSAEGTQKSANDVMKKKVFRNVDLIPSHLDLFSIDLDLGAAPMRETKLRRSLAPVLSTYRIIVCDCPPNLTIPTQNALAVSTHYVVPVSPDFLSAIGVGLLQNRIEELAKELERSLKNAGIVLCRIGRPSQHREDIQSGLRKQFKELVLAPVIKERSAVSEAAEEHKSVNSKGGEAAEEFEAVCRELLQRMEASR